MDFMEDYFQCGTCQSRDFTRIYNFSIRFHGVNFSDELIYEKRTDETYQCTKCARTYSKQQIQNKLDALKMQRRSNGD